MIRRSRFIIIIEIMESLIMVYGLNESYFVYLKTKFEAALLKMWSTID